MAPGAADRLVRDLMVRDPVTSAPDSKALDAVRRMAMHDIGCVIVTLNAEPIGILSERDVLRLEAGDEEGDSDGWHELEVSEVMTSPAQTIPDTEPWSRAMELMSQHSIRHLPVVHDGILVGVVSARDVLGHHTEVLELLVHERTEELQHKNEALAERERERAHDLEVAGRVQRRLLASPESSVDWVHVYTWNSPRDEVGGDILEILPLEDDSLRIFLGDVSGHGVQASLVTVLVKGSLATPLRRIASPGELLGGLNQFLDGLLPEQFVTALAARLVRGADGSCKLSVATAGHPAPLLVPAEAHGGVQQLSVRGMLLGVVPDPEYPETELVLGPGDRVLLFTDGLTERRSAAGVLFDENNLHAVLETTRGLDGPEVLPMLIEAAHTFGGESDFEDDTTCILIEIPT